MQHAIWADQGLLPGVLAGEARLADQAHGLGDELVEALDSHGDAAESQDSAVAHRDGERWGETNTVQEQRSTKGQGVKSWRAGSQMPGQAAKSVPTQNMVPLARVLCLQMASILRGLLNTSDLEVGPIHGLR